MTLTFYRLLHFTSHDPEQQLGFLVIAYPPRHNFHFNGIEHGIGLPHKAVFLKPFLSAAQNSPIFC